MNEHSHYNSNKQRNENIDSQRLHYFQRSTLLVLDDSFLFSSFSLVHFRCLFLLFTLYHNTIQTGLNCCLDSNKNKPQIKFAPFIYSSVDFIFSFLYAFNSKIMSLLLTTRAYCVDMTENSIKKNPPNFVQLRRE